MLQSKAHFRKLSCRLPATFSKSAKPADPPAKVAHEVAGARAGSGAATPVGSARRAEGAPAVRFERLHQRADGSSRLLLERAQASTDAWLLAGLAAEVVWGSVDWEAPSEARAPVTLVPSRVSLNRFRSERTGLFSGQERANIGAGPEFRSLILPGMAILRMRLTLIQPHSLAQRPSPLVTAASKMSAASCKADSGVGSLLL